MTRFKSATIVFVVLLGFKTYAQINGSKDKNTIFPSIGVRNPSEYFTGAAYAYSLVQNDTIYNTVSGSVFFEPGARSNWHYHPSGQILIVTNGKGYYQEKGNPIQIIRKGEVVRCMPNVEHWHGASLDSSLTHIQIIPNTEKGIVVWLKKVTDEEYNNLKFTSSKKK